MAYPRAKADDAINWISPLNRQSPWAVGLVAGWIVLQNQPGWKSTYILDLLNKSNLACSSSLTFASDRFWSGESSPELYGSIKFKGSDWLTKSVEETLSVGATFYSVFRVDTFDTDWQCLFSTAGNPCIGRYSNTNVCRHRWLNGTIDIQGTINVNDGRWHSVCTATAGDYIGYRTSVFVDGKLDITSVNGGAPGSITSWNIGSEGVGGSRTWKGNMSVLLVWNYRFTQQQQADIELERLAGFPSLLNRIPLPYYGPVAAGGVAYWAFQRQLSKVIGSGVV